MWCYKLINKTNGNFYIGVTINLKARMKLHKNSKGKVTICNAISKYGWENFDVIIMKDHIKTKDEMFKLEKFLIKELKPPYNETDGGEGTSGFKHSEETKKKMSESAKKVIRKPMSQSHKDAIGKALKGKKGAIHSLEARLNNSLRQLGKKRKPTSEATKLKISIANQGNKSMLGKTHSEETKLKMSLSKKKDVRIKPYDS